MYREMPADRGWVCPRCASAERGPLQGGPVACSRCRTPFTLPDRSAMLTAPQTPPMPSNDSMRIAQLRPQDGRLRLTPPTLQAVLGGDSIQPGREQEAIMVWQSLRARAQQGDVAASEDLSFLTLVIAQLESMQSQQDFTIALSESALDASVLPRHRQEQLGRLCRLAAARGDRGRVLGLLAMMNPNPQELDSDSEYRVSCAMLAVLDRDGARMLALLGPQKDAVPITDSMDAMASVFRAHAYELTGNIQAASQILRELPDPRILQLVQGRFQSMGLCAQSSQSYMQVQTQQAAQRAAASAGGIGCAIGVILALVGLIELAVGIGIAVASDAGLVGGAINGGIGVLMGIIGFVLVVRARAKGKHAAWLRTNGVSLVARVVDAQPTGTLINKVPVYRFTLQVSGPQGPYPASFDKLTPEHQVAMLMAREVRVRANPQKLAEVILEE